MPAGAAVDDHELARRSLAGFAETLAALGRTGVRGATEVRVTGATGARVPWAAGNHWVDAAVVPPDGGPPPDTPDLPHCLWSTRPAAPSRTPLPEVAMPCMVLRLAGTPPAPTAAGAGSTPGAVVGGEMKRPGPTAGGAARDPRPAAGGGSIPWPPGWMRSETLLEVCGGTVVTWRDAAERCPRGADDRRAPAASWAATVGALAADRGRRGRRSGWLVLASGAASTARARLHRRGRLSRRRPAGATRASSVQEAVATLRARRTAEAADAARYARRGAGAGAGPRRARSPRCAGR